MSLVLHLYQKFPMYLHFQKFPKYHYFQKFLMYHYLHLLHLFPMNQKFPMYL
jgi:hypothetical protein